jgi:DNA polymerase-3 subunit delta
MKLTARDSESFLKSPDKQVGAVLLYGPDSGLVRERSRAIASIILGKDADPLNRTEFSFDQLKGDPALLRDELSALSLMGGRRIVVIRDAQDKLATIIEEAFNGLTTTTYLIVEAEELSPSAGLRHLFEKDSRFAALPCYRDEGKNLEELIRKTLFSYNLQITSEACHYLAANLGNDRGVTHNELEKIALYMGNEKEITLPVVLALTDHNATETMEDMCYAVALGKAKEAEALLMQLLHEGTQPVAIIRTLLKHFQRLDIVQAHIGAGVSSDQAIAMLRPPIFFKYQPMVKREIGLWRPRAIANVLNSLLRAEKDLKSSLLTPPLLASHIVQQVVRMAA